MCYLNFNISDIYIYQCCSNNQQTIGELTVNLLRVRILIYTTDFICGDILFKY